jgi:hypothetical protein
MEFSRTLMLALVILLGILAMTDVLLTSTILRYGGQELNPLMAGVAGDPLQFLLVKGLVIAAILFLAVLSRGLAKDADALILTTACGVSIQPVVWNAVLLWLHSSAVV